MVKKKGLFYFCEEHIRGTAKESIVADKTIMLCHLSNAVCKVIELGPKVYMNTRALKHIYDKRPAEEFDFIVRNTYKIVKMPDFIYKNKNPKRGDLCFTKVVEDNNYFCSLEVKDESGEKEVYVVTVFRIRKPNYLNNYELLWSWKDGAPSS